MVGCALWAPFSLETLVLTPFFLHPNINYILYGHHFSSFVSVRMVLYIYFCTPILAQTHNKRCRLEVKQPAAHAIITEDLIFSTDRKGIVLAPF